MAPVLAAHAVLLRRSRTELQVGVDPSVVAPTSYEPLLRALAAGVPAERLGHVAARTGLDDGEVDALLLALDDAHLLRPPPPTEAAALRVVGCGPLGSRIAHELATAGVGRLYLADLPARAEGPVRSGAASRPSPVDLLSVHLRSAHPDVAVRRSRHVTEPEGDAVALTVVASDGPEPDRLATDLLVEHGAPHLLVRCSAGEAVVGPLVVPGTTSCVRCADLARRDADPRWPWLLDQLTRLQVEASPTLLTWAAVTATLQALAFVAGSPPETAGHTLELGAWDHTLRLRSWPVHPDCRCRPDRSADEPARAVVDDTDLHRY